MVTILLFFFAFALGTILAFATNEELVLLVTFFVCVGLTFFSCFGAPDDYRNEKHELKPIAQNVYAIEQDGDYHFSFVDKNKDVPYFRCYDIHTVDSKIKPYVTYKIQDDKLLKYNYRFYDISCADIYVPEGSIAYI